MSARWMRRAGLALAVAALPVLAAAQTPELDKSKRRLEEIRAEREQLRRDQERLQSLVRDTDRELENIERQRETTNRIVNELEHQIGGLGGQVDNSSTQLALAEDNLADRRAVLERRLVDIYKRGPLHTWQVLLSSESFSDLLSRYKYLYLSSRQDRTLVQDVERLRNRIKLQRGELVGIREQLDRSRAERESELKSYRELALERGGRLKKLKQNTAATTQRLSALARDENQLNEVLAGLERARRTTPGRPTPAPTTANPTPGATGLTTSDIGRLSWPVEGRIVHQFGSDTLPSGARITRHGISITAQAGSPVSAVAAGKVVLLQRLGTYGLSVILEHPNGYYSLYMQLGATGVKVGDDVGKGQVIGTVGGENTPEGSHLYFEIRGENQIALDPTDWLKKRR
ncbi:MAG: peptidoglycan DD-metalloendopeptidase family protein [Gemmatimonadota bacterium]